MYIGTSGSKRRANGDSRHITRSQGTKICRMPVKITHACTTAHGDEHATCLGPATCHSHRTGGFRDELFSVSETEEAVRDGSGEP
jgi:hypothetical protein